MNRPTHPQLVAALVKPGAAILASMTAERLNLWHAATGIAGEGAELLEAFTQPEPVDRVNVVEELGDLEFYQEQLRTGLGLTRAEVGPRAQWDELRLAARLVAVRSGAVLDLVKKVAIYNKPVDAVLEELVTTLGLLDIAMDSVRLCMDITREETLDANIDKLMVRYADGYSDAAAQARADKSLNQGVAA